MPATRKLLFVWMSGAVLLGGLLAVARAADGPLDDTDPALQRPGLLDAGPLPDRPTIVVDGVPTGGRPSVVFFTRTEGLQRLCSALADHDLGGAAVAIVVSAGEGQCARGPTVVADPRASIANAYGMRQPRGGGSPVGYAVVDPEGLIRYRTLDPTVHDELAEVDTILDAIA